MKRAEALMAINSNVANQNLVKHMLATEAVMRGLARRLGGDEEEWGMAGLLHDIDVEVTEGDMSRHSREGAEMAKNLGASHAVAHAILCHNERHGENCDTLMDKALFCADPLTGLITAAVLVRPDRQISGIEAKSVKKRFKERGFAAGASQENIDTCTEIGMTREEFVGLGLDAMKGIAEDLGL